MREDKNEYAQPETVRWVFMRSDHLLNNEVVTSALTVKRNEPGAELLLWHLRPGKFY